MRDMFVNIHGKNINLHKFLIKEYNFVEWKT